MVPFSVTVLVDGWMKAMLMVEVSPVLALSGEGNLL